ncbi:Hypothetical Protein FCC1311_095522 [Hondaea fermentalgiana]|uniref:Uncharacterized protein n=1 Tax=Hondaea fermentalgiana TaxID=2315210 RepID=A0A2R5GSP1_9STRA|nr:Hypothetical Protein FCC1311_095522 [Hondaea fermentalgiana]|eukprot:GBG33329.1 Hypothetical Protein FCC1311_095522 [Hondaea fermentalgiana]
MATTKEKETGVSNPNDSDSESESDLETLLDIHRRENPTKPPPEEEEVSKFDMKPDPTNREPDPTDVDDAGNKASSTMEGFKMFKHPAVINAERSEMYWSRGYMDQEHVRWPCLLIQDRELLSADDELILQNLDSEEEGRLVMFLDPFKSFFGVRPYSDDFMKFKFIPDDPNYKKFQQEIKKKKGQTKSLKSLNSSLPKTLKLARACYERAKRREDHLQKLEQEALEEMKKKLEASREAEEKNKENQITLVTHTIKDKSLWKLEPGDRIELRIASRLEAAKIVSIDPGADLPVQLDSIVAGVGSSLGAGSRCKVRKVFSHDFIKDHNLQHPEHEELRVQKDAQKDAQFEKDMQGETNSREQMNALKDTPKNVQINEDSQLDEKSQVDVNFQEKQNSHRDADKDAEKDTEKDADKDAAKDAEKDAEKDSQTDEQAQEAVEGEDGDDKESSAKELPESRGVEDDNTRKSATNEDAKIPEKASDVPKDGGEAVKTQTTTTTSIDKDESKESALSKRSESQSENEEVGDTATNANADSPSKLNANSGKGQASAELSEASATSADMEIDEKAANEKDGVQVAKSERRIFKYVTNFLPLSDFELVACHKKSSKIKSVEDSLTEDFTNLTKDVLAMDPNAADIIAFKVDSAHKKDKDIEAEKEMETKKLNEKEPVNNKNNNNDNKEMKTRTRKRKKETEKHAPTVKRRASARLMKR